MRVLIIGAGVIAHKHAQAAMSAGATEIHVCDLDGAALARFGDAFPAAHLHTAAEEMLAVPPEPSDIVIVATPPYTHRELVLTALAAGRHVLCEKPLAMSGAEAKEMRDAAQAAGLALGSCDVRFVGFPATEEAKRLLHGGTLGTPYHVTFVTRLHRSRSGFDYQPETEWFRDPTRSGGGVLMDWGPYDLAVLDDVFEPARVEIDAAWMSTPRTGDLDGVSTPLAEQHVGASMRLHLMDGTVVHVAYERAACTHGSERSVVELDGTQGAVRWDWLDGSPRQVSHGHETAGKATSTDFVAPTGDVSCHARPLASFSSAIAAERGRSVTDESVFRMVWLDAVGEAAATGRFGRGIDREHP